MLLLFACDGGSAKDSSAPGDTDTAPADSGDPADPDLVFAFDGDATGGTLTLWTTAFEEAWSGPVDDDGASVTFTPDAASFVDLGGGMTGAIFFPGVTVDGEWAGVGTDWPTYVDGTGWTVTSQDGTAGDPSDIPIELSLSPVLALGLAGDSEVSVAGAALAVIPVTGGAPVYDAPVSSGEWSFTLDGPPPSDHILAYTGYGSALEEIVLYTDDDGSGGYTGMDGVHGFACRDGQIVRALWTEIERVDGALAVRASGGHGGWSLFDDGGATDDTSGLHIAASCS